MAYTIGRLAALSGVSTRTIRYYGQIGLLRPGCISESGYRLYGEREVLRLQQILFFRALDLPLGRIGALLDREDFDALSVLTEHIEALSQKRDTLNTLIENAQQTIKSLKGEITMSDEQRFEGFKRRLIEQNEEKYGAEIREKYGDEEVERSNAKMMNMTEPQYREFEALSAQLNDTLKEAVATGDPASALAQEVARLHKRWLCITWPSYSKDAHRGLAQMYVNDPRFTAYYEQIAPGATRFLRDAIDIFCTKGAE